jgi:hypothetical protein
MRQHAEGVCGLPFEQRRARGMRMRRAQSASALQVIAPRCARSIECELSAAHAEPKSERAARTKVETLMRFTRARYRKTLAKMGG